jgi:hypothetical protein
MRCPTCGATMVKLHVPKPVATLGYRYRCTNPACRRTVQEVGKGAQRFVAVREARTERASAGDGERDRGTG